MSTAIETRSFTVECDGRLCKLRQTAEFVRGADFGKHQTEWYGTCESCGRDLIMLTPRPAEPRTEVQEDESASPRVLIEAAEATPVAALAQEYYALPEPTLTGVVCGHCSKIERVSTGDRRAQVRHASAAHVAYCYRTVREMKAEVAADCAAESAVERWFEEQL